MSARVAAESWRPIDGYVGHYEVSDQGRVRSLKRGREHVLKQTGGTRDYQRVTLCVANVPVTARVHRLVAEAFIGPCPTGLEVRHVNGNQIDNRATNLAYGTHAENIADAVAHGTHVEVRKTHCPAGHPYEGDNLKITPAGTRVCLTCKRIRENASRKAARRARGLKKTWSRREEINA